MHEEARQFLREENRRYAVVDVPVLVLVIGWPFWVELNCVERIVLRFHSAHIQSLFLVVRSRKNLEELTQRRVLQVLSQRDPELVHVVGQCLILSSQQHSLLCMSEELRVEGLRLVKELSIVIGRVRIDQHFALA